MDHEAFIQLDSSEDEGGEYADNRPIGEKRERKRRAGAERNAKPRKRRRDKSSNAAGDGESLERFEEIEWDSDKGEAAGAERTDDAASGAAKRHRRGGVGTATRSGSKDAKRKEVEESSEDEDEDEREAPIPQVQSSMERYKRKELSRRQLRNVKSKKLRGQLQQKDEAYKEAQEQAAATEVFLLPSEAGYLQAEEMERTCRITQQQIVDAVDIQSRRNVMDIELDQLGPYMLSYSLTGQHVLIAGEKGHVSLMHRTSRKVFTEMHLNEKVRDATFLHNFMYFAVAQKKNVYIYDVSGMELHRLKEHVAPNVLQFLPHHFLLASIGAQGRLVYQDTSTGEVIARHATNRGPCSQMAVNPHNAILCLGHRGGVVTMWSPTMTTPLVKMLCHRGPVTGVAIDKTGTYMTTSSLDRSIRIWDIRKFGADPLQHYHTPSPPRSLAVSQRGLLAIGCHNKIQVWKDAFAQHAKLPYIQHVLPSGAQAHRLSFCPYEDVLGIGHSKGFSTILVPGAGEANFDSMVDNPFQTRKQRREQEVHQLLEKIQPELIVLDPDTIGAVDPTAAAQMEETNVSEAVKQKRRNRKLKRELRGKANNVVTAKRQRAREANLRRAEENAKRKAAADSAEAAKEGGALARFR